VTRWIKLGKLLLKTGGIITLLFVVLLIWLDQSRTFYGLSEDIWITVWKRLGNKCYVIPGKYYSVLNPSDNYIKTSNRQSLTLFYSNKLSKTVLIRNEGESTGRIGGYKVINHQLNDYKILSYCSEYDKVLYKPDAYYFRDVKGTTEYIKLNIHENYATDKRGKKFR